MVENANVELDKANVATSPEEADKTHVLHGFSALRHQNDKNVIIVRKAEGTRIYDQNDNEYLDAGSGLWCANVGYGRKEIADVAAQQMMATSYAHSFSNFSNEPLIKLTDKILNLYPGNRMSRLFLGASGSDANDSQIKLVHRYNNVRGKPQKKKIISRLGSYHGSNIASGSLTGLPIAHRTFDLPISGILHTVCANYHRRPEHIESQERFSRYCADELDKLIEQEGPETVAAFIAEPICGAGGLFVPPSGYFQEIDKVLKKHDVLMIADEVITGFGRTGSWFASPKFEIEPDLITISKGMTSGYFPMSGCLISDRVADILYSEEEADGAFGHGYTASGHPVGAAVALANIDIMEREGLLENASSVGKYLLAAIKSKFLDHELVGDIRGSGLLMGIEFDSNKARRKPFENPGVVSSLLSKACLDQGLIVRGGHAAVVIAMAPPLILTTQEADEIVDKLEKAISKFTQMARTGGHVE